MLSSLAHDEPLQEKLLQGLPATSANVRPNVLINVRTCALVRCLLSEFVLRRLNVSDDFLIPILESSTCLIGISGVKPNVEHYEARKMGDDWGDADAFCIWVSNLRQQR